MRHFATAVAIALFAFALSACAEPAVPAVPKAAAEPGAPAQESTSATPAQLPDDPDLKILADRSQLPPGFPFEVAVVDGDVTLAKTPGGSALGPYHLSISVPAPADQVLAWYQAAFAQRSWRQTVALPEKDFWGFEKGAGAWSTLSITAEDEANTTVEQWLGIGVPIPDEAVPPGEVI